MRKYIFIDTETTGLDPLVNGLHQVSGEIVIGGKTMEKFNIKFKPASNKKIEKAALAVSNLTEEKVMRRSLSSIDAYHVFNNILTTHVDKYDKHDKFVFSGYCCRFDIDFLNQWYLDNGNKYLFGLIHGAFLDGLTLALLYEIKQGKQVFTPNRKLGTVADYFGLKVNGELHDAAADIDLTRRLIGLLWKEIRGQ